MAPLRVAVAGATGKMGREALIALSNASDMELVGATCHQDRGAYLEMPGTSERVPLGTDLATVLDSTKPHVLVDFTTAASVMAAAPLAAQRKIHLVTGTTGLAEGDFTKLEAISSENGVGIVVAANLSIGGVLLVHLAKQAAPYFDYVDIVETHHEAKIDAPSGTAQVIANAITEGKEYRRNVTEHENIANVRGGEQGGVGIHSIRMAGRVAHHEVVMGMAGQALTLRHDMISRDCCMPGMLLAIREVGKLGRLVVGLDKIMGL
jgi:4-hydroxy-tetrahydrodipicolinate reductase